MKAPVIGVALLALGIALNPAQSAQRHKPKAEPEQRIACTVLGCNPVRPECTSTYGRTAKGIPTGFDVILCPPGVEPFK